MYLEGPKEKTPPLAYCARCMVLDGRWRPAMALVAGTGYCADCVLGDADPTGLVRLRAEGAGTAPADLAEQLKQELHDRRSD